MAKSKQYKFSGIGNCIIEDGYTVLVISDGTTTATTPEEEKLAERSGGQSVIANVIERKKPTKKKDGK